jgi:dihydrofolate reductase
MQAPGRPDEDTRDGFRHGGWALPYNDAVMMKALGEGVSSDGVDMLFGRRTYQDFYTVWPARTDNPFSAALDRARKFVASRTLAEPLPWQHSTLLHGDAAETVARLKQEPGKDLLLFGSGDLMRTLMARRLVDRFILLTYPLILGTGRRLFDHDAAQRTALRLVRSVVTTTGVVIGTYEPA